MKKKFEQALAKLQDSDHGEIQGPYGVKLVPVLPIMERNLDEEERAIMAQFEAFLNQEG